LVIVGGAGCLKDYHPEYSPRTSYVVTQNISYPTTIVENVALPSRPTPPPSASVETSTPGRPAIAEGRGTPSLGTESGLGTASVEAPRDSTPRLHLPSAHVVSTEIPEGPKSRVPLFDPEARARCNGGDRASCASLPGVHLNGNVQIHGNVVLFGDVFINDATPVATTERGAWQ
jgi:hypothetical protein